MLKQKWPQLQSVGNVTREATASAMQAPQKP